MVIHDDIDVPGLPQGSYPESFVSLVFLLIYKHIVSTYFTVGYSRVECRVEFRETSEYITQPAQIPIILGWSWGRFEQLSLSLSSSL